MFLNENSSIESDSSSDSFNFDDWEDRVAQQNQSLDRIIEDLVLEDPTLIVGEQTPRARRRLCNRERELVQILPMDDYFVERPIYSPQMFRRIFRMQKRVFLRIVEAVTANDEYFQQRPNATSRLSLSPLQKCTAAMRVLAYGTSIDVVDEYLRISGDVAREALKKFVGGVIACFSENYLRRPNPQDLARLLHVGEQRGFPDTCNDINVLHRSPVFNDVLEGRAPKVNFVVNGHNYDMAYYLTDDIYPSWATFVKSIPGPQIRKHKLFAQHQEAVRKDVERAFGVLQARFAFLRRPCLVWDKYVMGQIMMAYIIMHNMIVEDERDTYQNYYDPTKFFMDTPIGQDGESDQPFQKSTERIASLSSYMTNRAQVRNRNYHNALQEDLIEHIWQKFNTHN